jgi:hypothetical protein
MWPRAATRTTCLFSRKNANGRENRGQVRTSPPRPSLPDGFLRLAEFLDGILTWFGWVHSHVQGGLDEVESVMGVEAPLRAVSVPRPSVPGRFGGRKAGPSRVGRQPFDPRPGPPLSQARGYAGGMRFRTFDRLNPPEEELIASFGEPRRVRTREGRLDLRGGTPEDRAAANEWDRPVLA